MNQKCENTRDSKACQKYGINWTKAHTSNVN